MIPSSQSPTAFLIVFLDLSRFERQSLSVEDSEIAATIDAFYALVAREIQSAGGRTVKFIGDAALAVFPENAVDGGVRMLLELKPSVDRFMTERGWECRLSAKAHFGVVIAGDFGPESVRRFDVIGRAVNATALLPSGGVTISAEAFRKLSPELRQSFKKHTQSTYSRVEDPRPVKRKR